ncbi:putative 7-deoxyloganetin glucosyltransferase [Helianthus debilis subsp. tardiflorus]
MKKNVFNGQGNRITNYIGYPFPQIHSIHTPSIFFIPFPLLPSSRTPPTTSHPLPLLPPAAAITTLCHQTTVTTTHCRRHPPSSNTGATTATKEIGCVVEWAPHEDVLPHPTIGGFLTHSGWNSTIQSMAEGVPMVCWPNFADQQVNSRFMGDVWNMGVDIKDTCDRLGVEKVVREIMDSKHNVFRHSATSLANSTKQSITKTGSSYINLVGCLMIF